ncbi:3-oxoacyl-[acyl-carrier-protein] reductase [Wickerhamomyces ciferrii]|uniref:3-oxoacyl-[acyl-carrier-protein] reductase n=1 Tax=Wickerhamomyces ciferrii (strain ATCC 14091 / BCRC 22168 / CBS 111 / JCM 3599 / NBRC 0793 / NRRL Y-1031 F-60-10) TaxID=1206466 RepID=K0KQF2_WICCF|nr:3-oxoacyl-[acyl-carrier-protein] reductase [Wickerhamomyces ciferrii]CCH44382.1 3-oxoacyl-[acyl-carrier-protein] reductase [Wickerhamomyces ciferrii]
MSSNVAIIFGAGAKVGTHVTQKFLQNGYKVVTVSRSDNLSLSDATGESYFHFKGDLADTKVVPSVFAKTKEVFGEPNVVVYNAAAVSRTTPNGEEFLKLTVEEVEADQSVNVTSALLAIQEAVKSFKTLPNEKSKAFIYTGNIQYSQPFPFISSLGLGKAGAYSALTVANEYFSKDGYKFYFADERTVEGGPAVTGVSGEAAADFYFDLAENENKDIPVLATFVKGKGYVKF